MASHDMFKYELPFEITKKGNRGTTIGFVLSVVYMVLLWLYILSQFRLFFTFQADSYEHNIIELDFEEMEPANLEDLHMGIGLLFKTMDETKYESALIDPKEFSQYIRVVSLEKHLEGGIADQDKTKLDDLISCKGILNSSKFKNFKTNKVFLCVNPEAGYKIIGNMDTESQVSIDIQIRRCEATDK